MEEEISEIAQNAVDAFSYDHPEVFWIYNVKYSYRISGQSTETGCLVKNPLCLRRRYSVFRKVIKVSGPLDLDHGNDMTYNTDRKRLVVLHSTGKGKRLSVIRTDTLKVESVKDVKISSVLEGATTDEAKAILIMKPIIKI